MQRPACCAHVKRSDACRQLACANAILRACLMQPQTGIANSQWQTAQRLGLQPAACSCDVRTVQPGAWPAARAAAACCSCPAARAPRVWSGALPACASRPAASRGACASRERSRHLAAGWDAAACKRAHCDNALRAPFMRLAGPFANVRRWPALRPATHRLNEPRRLVCGDGVERQVAAAGPAMCQLQQQRQCRLLRAAAHGARGREARVALVQAACAKRSRREPKPACRLCGTLPFRG